MNLLSGKNAIITGASRGIGKATAEIFARNGANLFLLARNFDALNNLKTNLEKHHNVKVFIFKVDIMDLDELKKTFKEIRATKLKIDVLVNNAGIMEDAVLQMANQELIHKIYSTNVFGLINTTQLGLKLMIKNQSGSIINLSSIIGIEGNHGQAIYSSSKSAVIGFTKSMSKELAPFNIRVNAVAPGYIDTDMTRGMSDVQHKKSIDSIGLKRIGTPEDVANLNLFLASDLSEYITGQVIGIDGGMII